MKKLLKAICGCISGAIILSGGLISTAILDASEGQQTYDDFVPVFIWIGIIVFAISFCSLMFSSFKDD